MFTFDPVLAGLRFRDSWLQCRQVVPGMVRLLAVGAWAMASALAIAPTPAAAANKPDPGHTNPAHAGKPAPKPTRGYRLGLGTIPHDFTPEAVATLKRTLASSADMVAITLDKGVPWSEALADKPFHTRMIEDWRNKAAFTPNGGRVLLSVTPLDEAKRGPALSQGEDENMPRPPEFAGLPLNDPKSIRAYANYVRRAVEFFRPAIVIIGIDVDELFVNAPDEWDRYVELHKAVYGELRRRFPKLTIAASFALHQMHSPLRPTDQRDEATRALRGLDEFNDLTAVSVMPVFAGQDKNPRATEEMLEWLQREFGPTKRPYAFVAAGHPAEPLKLAVLKFASDPAAQALVLEKLLAFADSHDTMAVVWILARDYDALWERLRGVGGPMLALFRDWGLADGQGKPRPALEIWRRALARPFRDTSRATPPRKS